VIDPETQLDAVRNVGIVGTSIRNVTSNSIAGRDTIDAKGLVVAPGFIDLHQHAQSAEAYAVEATGGITTALELEYGTDDIDKWYDARAGKSPINYGASVGHLRVRMAVMHDPGRDDPVGDAAHRAATDVERAEIARLIELGLRRGAPAVGMAIEITPAASRLEVLDAFHAAARRHASVHSHLRDVSDDPGDVSDIQEVLADALISGAALHVVHLNSTAREETPRYLALIQAARARHLDVTTEMYPYESSMQSIESTPDWRTKPDAWFSRIEIPATGERLTRTSFEQHLSEHLNVIGHAKDTMQANAWLLAGIASPLPMFASDGILDASGGHPRVVGTFARILGRYVRDEHVISLSDAIRRMTLEPARRLEARVPQMKRRGRVQPGADADLVVFDAATIADRATYREPATAPAGIPYVLVNGTVVVRHGALEKSVVPGRPVRAMIE
jgi:N-acyl-D-aspartate/D-glutamate deacylase